MPFRADQWPDNIPLLYYSYHIMVGLGTIVHRDCGGGGVPALARQVVSSRWMLWILLLTLPFPVHRQHGGMDDGRTRTSTVAGLRADANGSMATHKTFQPGNGLFTLLGFMGMYTVLGILFLFLIRREIERGPEAEVETGH